MRRVLAALALALVGTSAFARVPDWLQQAAATPLPAYDAETKGVALLDETLTTVEANGRMRTLTRRAYKVLTTAGRDLGYVAVHFDSDTKLTSFRAWAISASGEEYQVKERDAVESAAFDGELYADNKVKVLRIPAAEPGSVVGYEYEQLDRPYAGMEQLWVSQGFVPVRRARFTAILPEGWKYEARWTNREPLEPRALANQLVWEVSDVEALRDETGMPDSSAVAPRLAVRFISPAGAAQATWNDVGRWYAGLVASRNVATPAIAAKARELTATAPTQYEKIVALARFAQHDVRYVAIEIGIGGFQPHAADAVFTNRYGDCKDKVTVLSAMLRELGIESYYVLINTERGVVDRNFASHRLFNHAVIAIALPPDAPKDLPATIAHPKLGRLLVFDPTIENVAPGTLPPWLQENRGLLVTHDGGELVDLGVHAPETSRLARTAKLTLDPAGMLDGSVREVRTGAIAARYRADLRSMNESERKQYVERQLASSLTQYAIRDLTIENTDDASKELVLSYKLTAPAYAKRAAGMLLVRPRLLGRKADAIAELEKRRFAYVMDSTSLETDEIEIVVPQGLVADELPPVLTLETPAGSYKSESKFEGNRLEYRREYRVDRLTVPVGKIAELNKAFSQILADERAIAVLVAK